MDAVGQGRSAHLLLYSPVRWAVLVIPIVAGCGDFSWSPAPTLFTVPLSVEGREVSPAILDTGGGFEVLLREDFGLPILGDAEVLAFGGREVVQLTSGFRYSAGGIETTADFALVGVSTCDCNGLGYHFFRKTGIVLELDFRNRRSSFLNEVPKGDGPTISFVSAPSSLTDFDTSFIVVDIGAGLEPPAPGQQLPVSALLDTGSTITAVRRSLVDSGEYADLQRMDITIAHPQLGTLGANAVLFDTPDLPGIILGVDAMAAWGDRWYFSFSDQGGTVTVQSDKQTLDVNLPAR